MSDNNDILNDILNETANNNAEPEKELPHEEHETHKEVSHEHAYQEEIEEPHTPTVSEERPETRPPQPRRTVQGSRPIERPPHPKKKKKKKKKRRSNRLPGVLILVTLIFGISIISSLVIISFGKDMLGIGKSEETHVIVIPDGATTEQVALMLLEDEIIKSSEAFKLFAEMRNKEMTYVSGEHFVRPNMPYETIIDELTKVPTEEMGESIQVTFPEGTTLIDAANILEKNHICDAEEFIFYFNAGGFGIEFEDRLPVDTSMKFEKMEGYLFPDTYFFYENSKPEEVCQKIYYNFDTKMNGEFTVGKKHYETRYERMEDLNMSLDELITLASIVQKEAATADVMNDVASVFRNRLENSDEFPLLQSDPTSNYSKDVIRPNIEYLNETLIDAYDTYKTPGLPPGAICNPGIEAIDAVLTNKKTKNFYFIANINTNETFFSETLEEHEQKQAEIEQSYIDAQYNE